MSWEFKLGMFYQGGPRAGVYCVLTPGGLLEFFEQFCDMEGGE